MSRILRLRMYSCMSFVCSEIVGGIRTTKKREPICFGWLCCGLPAGLHVGIYFQPGPVLFPFDDDGNRAGDVEKGHTYITCQ